MAATIITHHHSGASYGVTPAFPMRRGKLAYILATGHFECFDCDFCDEHQSNGEPEGGPKLQFTCPGCGRKTTAAEINLAVGKGEL